MPDVKGTQTACVEQLLTLALSAHGKARYMMRSRHKSYLWNKSASSMIVYCGSLQETEISSLSGKQRVTNTTHQRMLGICTTPTVSIHATNHHPIPFHLSRRAASAGLLTPRRNTTPVTHAEHSSKPAQAESTK